MTGSPKGPREQLSRLADALARDVDRLSADEIRQEIVERHGSMEAASADMRSRIAAAIAEAGKRRLAAARKSYDRQTADTRSSVMRLTLDEKRALVEHFASNDNTLKAKITMAARNQDGSESDIDSLLEDLLQLGVIDPDGNIE